MSILREKHVEIAASWNFVGDTKKDRNLGPVSYAERTRETNINTVTVQINQNILNTMKEISIHLWNT